MSRLWLVLGLCLLAGCALFGKGKPLALRYFDLKADSSYQPKADGAANTSGAGAPLRLRLGPVSAARYLDRRFVCRSSPQELSFYDEWRWSDQPETFVRRTLERDLFERARLVRVVSGPAPTLEVELIAFEELKLSDRHRARAALSARMHDDRSQLWQRTFAVESEIGKGDAAQALAAALGEALARASAELSEQTVASLAAAGAQAAAR